MTSFKIAFVFKACKLSYCVRYSKGSFCTIRNATSTLSSPEKDAQHLDNDTTVRYYTAIVIQDNSQHCSCCFLISLSVQAKLFELRCKSSNKLVCGFSSTPRSVRPINRFNLNNRPISFLLSKKL